MGEVITLQRGFDLPHRLRSDGNVPVVTSSGISGTHDKAQVRAPGVVTGRYGTIGEVFFVCKDFWPLNTTLYVKDFKGNDPLFVSYFLRTIDFASYSGKSGVPGVNRNDLHGLIVSIPCPSEQRAIAAALSDTDALIGALDRLIAKKRATKLAAMQQFASGRVRALGFSSAWRTCELGDLGRLSKGRGIKKGDVADAGVPCIRYGEIYTHYDNYVAELVSRIPLSVAATAVPIGTGDLVFAGSGETAEEIGKCVAYVGSEQAYAGGDTIVLSPEGADPWFLGHLLNGPSVAEQKARYGQGDAVVHISARNLGRLKLTLPPIEEQRAIATILVGMDAEIVALQSRRDKTNAIKQGMMQALLTGRVRLVKPEVAV